MFLHYLLCSEKTLSCFCCCKCRHIKPSPSSFVAYSPTLREPRQKAGIDCQKNYVYETRRKRQRSRVEGYNPRGRRGPGVTTNPNRLLFVSRWKRKNSKLQKTCSAFYNLLTPILQCSDLADFWYARIALFKQDKSITEVQTLSNICKVASNIGHSETNRWCRIECSFILGVACWFS